MKKSTLIPCYAQNNLTFIGTGLAVLRSGFIADGRSNMRILIGYNGTEFAKAAIADMERAGFPSDAVALVITVAETCFPTVKPSDAEDLAAEGMALAQAIFPDWKLASVVSKGAPARELIAASELFKPDLIVLGEPNRKEEGAENVFLGPVSQGLLTDSNIPLRISRHKATEPHPFAKLLIGFDGSPGSEMAVQAVTRRVWPKGTAARVVSVENPGVLGSMTELSPQVRAAAVGAGFASQWAETIAEHAIDELKKAGLDTDLEVRTGHPRTALIEAADEWDADCIIVAPHCAGNSYERFLLGSVSASVAAHANCTVEIVR